MAPGISALPNRLYYGGVLQDGDGVEDEAELSEWFSAQPPFSQAITRLDHTALETWTSSIARGQRSSRCNILAAALTVDAVSRMLRPDRPALPEGARPRVLVMSPYRPQAELLQAMLRCRHLHYDAAAGTPHAFQGSEASAVLLDLTVAAPHYRAGIFSSEHSEGHRRLLNVAITRARRRLVVVGDLSFLRPKAGDSALGRLLRHLATAAPSRPDVRPILRLTPEPDLGEIVARAERYVVWYVKDPDNNGALAESIAGAAGKGLPVLVITDPRRMTRVGLRGSALTQLRDSGAALMQKDSLREAILIVDGEIVALGAATTEGWSVWKSGAVAGLAASAHQVAGLIQLVESGRARCERCDQLLLLREGDHSKPGLYAQCSKCGRSAGSIGRPSGARHRRQQAAL